MAGAFPLESTAIVVGLLIAVTTAYGAWRNRPNPGATSLAVLLLALADIALFSLLDALVSTPADVVFKNLVWLGYSVFAALWLVFVLSYTGRDRWLTRRRLALLFVLPALFNVILWLPVDSVFGITAGTTLLDQLESEAGGVYFVFTTLSWGALAVGSVLLVGHSISSNALFKRQGIAIITALILAWGSSVGNVYGLFGALSTYSILVGFLLMAVVLFVGVYGIGLTDLTPVAHSTVVRDVAAGILVVDQRGRITEVNPRARDVLGIDHSRSVVGKTVEELFADESTLAEVIGDEAESSRELTVGQGATERTIKVEQTGISRGSGERTWTVVLLYDITREKHREQELRLLKRVFSRVLRHNIRNDLTAIRGYAEMLADRGPEDRELAENIIAITDDLLTTAEKARDIEEAIESEDVAPVELTAIIRQVVDDARQTDPGVEFRTSLPAETWVLATSNLEIAIKNLVENAVRYNETGDRWVEIAIEEGSDSSGESDSPSMVELVVEDNGMGIHDDEIAAVESREELALQHGSGLGLYLVSWVVHRSGGTLSFSQTRSGTRVTVSLQEATTPEGPSE